VGIIGGKGGGESKRNAEDVKGLPTPGKMFSEMECAPGREREKPRVHSETARGKKNCRKESKPVSEFSMRKAMGKKAKVG